MSHLCETPSLPSCLPTLSLAKTRIVSLPKHKLPEECHEASGTALVCLALRLVNSSETRLPKQPAYCICSRLSNPADAYARSPPGASGFAIHHHHPRKEKL